MTAISLLAIALIALPWPFLTNSSVERIQRGYGDYNSGNIRAQFDGFHPGMDVFPPTPGSIIQLPFPGSNYVAECEYVSTNTWSLLITNSYPPSGTGYLYHHVYGLQTAYTKGSLITQMSKCADPLSGGYRHVHISVYDPTLWGTGSGGVCPEPGISNIINELSFTDQVKFAGVYDNRGIAFYKEDGSGYYQDIIRGAVDFVVSPRSVVPGYVEKDSCGVLSIGINSITRQNPLTEEYSIIDYYSPRTVFDWSQNLVDCVATPAPSEYFYLYEGGLLPSFFISTQFNMFYHISNSSINEPGDSGIGNIWVDPYSSQADYIFSTTPGNPEVRCRGAWDTILKVLWSSEDQSACENSEACFPDGRYLVDVTATSQTGSTNSILLPDEDVTSPVRNPLGVIVDNFVPFVQQVVLYTTYPDGSFHLLYHNTWNTKSSTTREPEERPVGYLPSVFGNSSDSYLGIAIRFSEPMDEGEIPAVWLEGIWSDEVQWSSQESRLNWFFPSVLDPIIPTNALSPWPSADQSGHWVFYRTNGYEDPGYVGSVRVCIGQDTSIPGTGAGLDLAGNALDETPESINPPLSLFADNMSDYGENRSSVIDSYQYGNPPSYTCLPPYPFYTLRGSTGLTEFNVTIDTDLTEITNCYGYKGDCPWNHGFWVLGHYCTVPTWDSSVWVHTSIVYPDGSYSTNIVQSEFAGNYEEHRIVIPPVQKYYINDTGDYLWYIIETIDYDNDPQTPQAGESWWHLYCISREAECVLFECIYNGYGYHYSDNGILLNSDDGGYRSNFPVLTNVEFLDSFTLRVDYWVPTGPSSGPPYNGYYAYKVYSVPDPNSLLDVQSEANVLQSDSPLLSDENLNLHISISTNPITGSATLNYCTLVTGHARVQVFDLTGRSISTLVNEEVNAGNHSVNWTPGQIPSGVYFVRLTTTSGTACTQAMVLR